MKKNKKNKFHLSKKLLTLQKIFKNEKNISTFE